MTPETARQDSALDQLYGVDPVQQAQPAMPYARAVFAACTCSLCSGANTATTGSAPAGINNASRLLAQDALGGSGLAHDRAQPETGALVQPQALTVTDFSALLSSYSITATPATGAFYSFSFPVIAPAYLADEFDSAGIASFQAFSESEKAIARQAIGLLGAATGLTFFEVAPGEGDIKFMIADVQLLGQGANTAAFAYYPTAPTGNFLISELTSDTFFDPGRATLRNILHELGHAVGLKHPFDGDTVLPANLDNTNNTVMAYALGGLPVTDYRALDIQALQTLYGDNSRDGDQIASWSWDAVMLTLSQSGSGNAETIRGIGGSDIIFGQGGDDRIIGGEGNDQIDGGSGNDTLYGDAGDDRLTGGDGQDTIYAGDGNDILVAGSGTDFLIGDAGDDLFLIPAGAVFQVSGGTGFDTVSYDGQSAGVTYTINTSRRVGSVTETHSSIEAVIGTAFADTLAGSAADNRLTGLGGDDRLSGGGGNDSFVYTARGFGADTITDWNAGDRVDLAALGVTDLAMIAPFLAQSGSDAVLTLGYDGTTERIAFAATTIASFSASSFVFATGTAAVTVVGTGQRDVLFGTGFDDRLTGGGGADSLVGGGGDDSYVVDSQDDLIFENAAAGDDIATASSNFYLYANVERLALASAAGDIFGVGNDLANTISGNEGRNLIIGGGGGDTLSGAAGNDALFGETGNDTLNGDTGIDYLVGGDGNDTLNGGAGPDAIYGEAGNDTLVGGSDFQTDILVGGDGNDTLDAASGLGDYDLIEGGAGDDSYRVDTPDDLTFEAAGGGTDTIFANIVGAGYYLYAHTENLVLEGQTPFGVGNELANVLTGNAIGNYLLGGAGNDVLNGKGGNDVLFGEGGADIFVFDRGTGGDVIGDFQPGLDRIQLTGLGITSFAQLQGLFVQNGGTSAIDLGLGDFVVLNGVAKAQLTAADFILG